MSDRQTGSRTSPCAAPRMTRARYSLRMEDASDSDKSYSNALQGTCNDMHLLLQQSFVKGSLE